MTILSESRRLSAVDVACVYVDPMGVCRVTRRWQGLTHSRHDRRIRWRESESFRIIALGELVTRVLHDCRQCHCVVVDRTGRLLRAAARRLNHYCRPRLAFLTP